MGDAVEIDEDEPTVLDELREAWPEWWPALAALGFMLLLQLARAL